MCGIAGFNDPQLNKENALHLMQKMLKSTQHRGPDNTSQWRGENAPLVLGHNRLSIIDLTDEANQPMPYQDLMLIFNGEIYNYIEVRAKLQKEGYQFHTASDTEVLLAAYKHWGSNCVQYFMGMWAFAIWDKTKKELFCSRDRFGIKPLYYIHQGDRFYFASEYKPLKLSPLFTNTPNLQQISRGLQLGWVHYQNETYFKVIQSLPAASNLLFKNGQVHIQKYWDVDFNAPSNATKSWEEKTHDFYELFKRSMQQHMRSDVEVGGCLSGGIDSSAIASAVGTFFPDTKFKTFTIYYDGKNEVDERPFAEAVTNKYPNLIPNYHSPTNTDLQESIARCFYHMDVPLPGSSPVSQYFVMQLAGKHNMKVLIDGQGSDEYLAGYMHGFYRLFGGLLKQVKFIQMISGLNQHKKMQGFSLKKTVDLGLKSSLTSVMNEQALYKLEYQKFYPYMSILPAEQIPFQLADKGNSRLDKFLYQLLFNTLLPSLLHYEDRNSMAFSIESRVPFLDHRLVEYAFTLKDDDKINKGITKYILRQSMQSILPKAIVERTDKKGFVTPGEVKWLRGPLKHLLDFDYSLLAMLDRKKVKVLMADYHNGNNKNSMLVWRLATLHWWLKRV